MEYISGFQISIQRFFQSRVQGYGTINRIVCNGYCNFFTNSFGRILQHGGVDIQSPVAPVTDKRLLEGYSVHCSANWNRPFVLPGSGEDFFQNRFRHKDERIDPDAFDPGAEPEYSPSFPG